MFHFLISSICSVLQPVEFTAGLDAGSGGVKQPVGEGAGGLFSGASGPKPPPALSQAVIGMKAGGKVSTLRPITMHAGPRPSKACALVHRHVPQCMDTAFEPLYLLTACCALVHACILLLHVCCV